MLSTARGYQIPLEHWPEKHWSTINVREEQQSVLQEEVARLREKEAVHPAQKTEAHIRSQSSFCGAQERGRLEVGG